MKLQDGTYSEPSQSQTVKTNNETNQCLTQIQSLISKQTTKLENAIAQVQTELIKQLEIKESFLCISKAFEEASEAICITDANGNITNTNKAFVELFGYSIDELSRDGGLFTRFVTTAVGQEIHNLILNGYTWKGEVEMRVCSGELIQVELYTSTIENSSDQVIGIVFLFTNITHYKQVEVALKQSEERLRLALKATHMAAWEWNLKTKKIVWFHNLETIFGFKPETFSGNFDTLFKYIHPDDHQKLTCVIGYAFDEYMDYNIHIRLFKTDESICWVEAKGQLLYDETGQATRMLGTVIDITKRKKAEELAASHCCKNSDS
ncbi:MAG: PAS domain-containing protein [Fischerella sp. CENA71]|nr:PAS domain-containing protein [Fischerella sp. CENA71]